VEEVALEVGVPVSEGEGRGEGEGEGEGEGRTEGVGVRLKQACEPAVDQVPAEQGKHAAPEDARVALLYVPGGQGWGTESASARK
jgi:hypothetical protein